MAENTTTIKAPTAIKTIVAKESDLYIQFFDNGSITIEEFNGKGEQTTYICLDKETARKIVLNYQIF